MRRVLIVDDEPHIRTVLRAYLEADGVEVTEAADAETALATLRTDPPDLVLLDVMLPGMDGLELLRQVRGFSEVYVILVTARTEEVDKLVGLGVGADDYVTKPFSPREVTARVKAVLRRDRGARADRTDAARTDAATDAARTDAARTERTEGNAPLRFEGLTIDPDRREVMVGATPVVLSALEFDLLTAMARAPGRVFSRAQLLEQVWSYDFYGDERVVDVHIRNLRAHLRDDASSPHLLATVRGVGYKFVGLPS